MYEMQDTTIQPYEHPNTSVNIFPIKSEPEEVDDTEDCDVMVSHHMLDFASAEPECLLKMEEGELDLQQHPQPPVDNLTTPLRHRHLTSTLSSASSSITKVLSAQPRKYVPHECKYCKELKQFKSFTALVRHLTFHHKFTNSCNFCKNVFATEEELESHIHENHSVKDITEKESKFVITSKPCPICEQNIDVTNFKIHIKSHQTQYPCKFCDRTFIDEKSLERHTGRYHDKSEASSRASVSWNIIPGATPPRQCICELCGKIYKGPKGLSYHMLLHTGEHPHVCLDCGQAFIYRSSLLSHQIRLHGMTSPYICSVCGRVLMTKTSLDDHERKHTGEKPYSCDMCDKSFSSKAHLSTHKYEHIEKEMKCNLCDEMFSKRSDYYRHRARYHLPPRKKNHICTVCGLALTRKKGLTDHLRVHTKEKPFQCDLCGKCFGQKELITMHIRSHFQIRPNVCPTCGKRFPNKQALIVHERVHTGEKPHVCRVCYQSFNQINSLKRHLKLHNAKYHLCNVCGQDFDVKTDLRMHQREVHNMQ